MKKVLAILLVILSVCSVCACSRKKATEAPNVPVASASATSPAPTGSSKTKSTSSVGSSKTTDAAEETPSSLSDDVGTNENTPAAGDSTPVPPSSNKEVVTDDDAPVEIYWLKDSSDNLTYHLENCEQVKGDTAQKISWILVKTIGLRQCPECNPPQYVGYVDAE